jgi:hypothetical protein
MEGIAKRFARTGESLRQQKTGAEMRVRVSFDFDEHFRLALAEHWGRDQKTSREDIATWISALVTAGMEDICADYDAGANRSEGEQEQE